LLDNKKTWSVPYCLVRDDKYLVGLPDRLETGLLGFTELLEGWLIGLPDRLEIL